MENVPFDDVRVAHMKHDDDKRADVDVLRMQRNRHATSGYSSVAEHMPTEQEVQISLYVPLGKKGLLSKYMI